METTGELIAAQQNFISVYPQNIDRTGKHDVLPLLGSSLMKYLSSFLPEDKRLLLKIPNVQYLKFFSYENIMLLIRDGCDLVSSTIKSWPKKYFAEVCSV